MADIKVNSLSPSEDKAQTLGTDKLRWKGAFIDGAISDGKGSSITPKQMVEKVSDAPNTGEIHGRQDGAWVPINDGVTEHNALSGRDAAGAHPDATSLASGFMSAALHLKLSQMRESVFVETHYYVDKTGNDNNDGLSKETAFLTPQKLLDTLFHIDGHGNSLRIFFGSGTWGGFRFEEYWFFGWSTVILAGNGSDTIFSTGNLDAGYGVVCTVRSTYGIELENFKVENNAIGLGVFNDYVIIRNIDFGFNKWQHIALERPGSCLFCWSSAYTISGPADAHILCRQQSQAILYGSTITIKNNPSFPAGFFVLESVSEIDIRAATFSGACTGKKYYIEAGGVIRTPLGDSSIPGTIAGQKVVNAVSLYADIKRTTATLTAAGWAGAAAPFAQTVTITTAAKGSIGVATTLTDAQASAAVKAGIAATASTGTTVTFKAFGTKPTVDIPIEYVGE